MTTRPNLFGPRAVLLLTSLLVIAVYALLLDLKGISTDEGFRLWIIHGGQSLARGEPAADASWARVLAAIHVYAYQPLYFLIQNSLMRMLHLEGLTFFRSVNLAFLSLALLGLLVLSRSWRLLPRLFLLGVFSFNAFLFMHVLQIREYIAGVAFYIWSACVVLELDRREQAGPGANVAWFAGYGALLTTGFYLQSWVVFPSIAQFLFLLLRRRAHWGRFLRRLALTYAVVLCATIPYLATHQEKMNVGLWASESESLESHLANGFHLLLTGHVGGHARFTEFLYYFWPAVIAGGAFLFLWDQTSAPAAAIAAESRRQGLLMILSIAVSLAFQIGYTLCIENLAVWPRYFVIHYFFLVWLIALSFRYLWELRATRAPGWTRHALTFVAGGLVAVLTASAVYQVRSFRADPYLDTGQNSVTNWRNVATSLARAARPGDVVVMSDFINRATLTFTQPMAHEVWVLPELERRGAPPAARLVYVEPAGLRAERDKLVSRLKAQGYAAPEESPVLAPDGVSVANDWRILTFSRR